MSFPEALRQGSPAHHTGDSELSALFSSPCEAGQEPPLTTISEASAKQGQLEVKAWDLACIPGCHWGQPARSRNQRCLWQQSSLHPLWQTAPCGFSLPVSTAPGSQSLPGPRHSLLHPGRDSLLSLCRWTLVTHQNGHISQRTFKCSLSSSSSSSP